MKNRYSVIFPGQGSQSVGMLNDFSDEFKNIFQVASKILNYDLWELIQINPNNLLDQTAYTQVAMLVSGYSLWMKWQKNLKNLKFMPAIFAGHSLGEYTALLAAQSLEFTDAVQLVATRGRLMQEAVPEGVGAMAAILGLSDQVVENLCADLKNQNKEVAAANFNSPGQVVVAGNKSAVEELVILAKAAGAKLVKVLAVSVPAHCILMQPAADEFAKHLENTKILQPKYPVIRNVDAEFHRHPDDIRQFLVKQLISPVRWVDCVERISAENISNFIECGPGAVLTNLIKRIDMNLTGYSLASLNNFDRASNEINKISEMEDASA